MVHDRLLDAGASRRLRTLVLPNIAALSDAQCAQLRAFVERGGGLVATYETSLYDEWGAERDGLRPRRTCSASRSPAASRRRCSNAYLRLEHDRATGNALLAGLEDAPRIIHGVNRLDVRRPRPFGPAPLTLIPSYPDLPMEKVYPRVPKTDVPQAFLREVGPGRVVYFPWDIDRTFWEVLAADHGTLLRNAVTWATNEEPRRARLRTRACST